MAKDLREQLERIHSLNYGPAIVQENFFKNLLVKLGLSKKTDDPKKSDYLSGNVDEFFDVLNYAAESGGIKQQSRSDYSYQASVEALQIGLLLLGYELPKSGVDGIFGPETAQAVRKFKLDNSILNEDAQRLRDTLDDLGYSEKGSEISSGGNITNEISGIVSDILRDYKEINPKVKVVVTAGNDKFHKTLPYKSKHVSGNAVDIVLQPYNSKNASDFIKLLQKYKSQDSKFSFIDEYTNPTSKATGGHFHLSYGGKAEGGISTTGEPEVATPEMLNKLSDLLKSKGVTQEDLKKYVDINRSMTSLEGVAANDFNKIISVIIDNLEGGYYHPDMLQDGRVNDSRYGDSGETMFGLDRVAGGSLNDTPEGRKFWQIIDNANARQNWSWNYKGGPYAEDLKNLISEIIKRAYLKNTKFLSKEAKEIINSSTKLTFNFVYATYNGPGWFQYFAKEINKLIANGITDPEELSDRMVKARLNSGNSLIAQGGRKIERIIDTALT